MNIGIDLGGSHVGIGVVDNNGKILEKFLVSVGIWHRMAKINLTGLII